MLTEAEPLEVTNEESGESLAISYCRNVDAAADYLDGLQTGGARPANLAAADAIIQRVLQNPPPDTALPEKTAAQQTAVGQAYLDDLEHHDLLSDERLEAMRANPEFMRLLGELLVANENPEPAMVRAAEVFIGDVGSSAGAADRYLLALTPGKFTRGLRTLFPEYRKQFVYLLQVFADIVIADIGTV